MSDTHTLSRPRYDALRDIQTRDEIRAPWPIDTNGKELPASRIFRTNTFGLHELQAKIPGQTYKKLEDLVAHGGNLDKETADTIANAVKEWAIERGVTHFAHWFQPMTGSTAEKHDAFLSIDSHGNPMEQFTGSMLIQGEPDASSFPSGGTRSTFEARGYTAWDVSSPMFILEGQGGWKTLCIPSAFMSYTGESLDKKTPLLRSMKAINQQALRLLKLLGDQQSKWVKPTVGAEQEYFLIDRSFAQLRPDLIMADRTLFGSQPSRHQQLEDHYFGTIHPRIGAFMREVELELYKMGVPAKTKHNEVAPAQYELAPIFEDANVAADHNQIMMETLRRVAHKHKFMALIHEKPFSQINGNGKHNNWSLSTDQGENLLDPGKTPHENLRFITFLTAILWGIHKHSAIVRASIASHGNDFRLGANEAPPAIISIFLGTTLTAIVETLEKGKVPQGNIDEAMLELGISNVPKIPKGNTDRNRTSPFAFTGNKFEFRAVGSHQSISWPVTIVQTAVADGIKEVTNRLEAAGCKPGKPSEDKLFATLQTLLLEAKSIRFDGNNYSDDWVKEAKKRGLPHHPKTPESLKSFLSPESKKVFQEFGVLSQSELQARYNVRLERYIKQVEIEVNTFCEILNTLILPAARSEQSDLIQFIQSAESSGHRSTIESLESSKDTLEQLSNELSAVHKIQSKLLSEMKTSEKMDEVQKGDFYEKSIIGLISHLEQHCNQIESLVSDEKWPLPKYREMLFIR